MEIRKFIFEGAQKRKLFALVGEFCVDAKLRAELGAPISSAPGDIWLVGIIDGEAVTGFCALTPQKNGKARLHAFHADTHVVAKALRREAVKEAKGISANALHYTASGELTEILMHEGWAPSLTRGQYVTFEKAL